MVTRLYTLLALLTFSILFAGCPNKPDPNPTDTMMGDSGSSRNPNYVSTPPPSLGNAQSDLFPEEGLFPRDELNDGARLEDVLPSVYFDFDQSFIREDQRDQLMDAFEYLSDNSEVELLVEGHCDYKGTREYNLALGERRAESVKTFLTQLGVEADRIQTLSHGDLEAKEDATDEERAEDRRADLIVIE